MIIALETERDDIEIRAIISDDEDERDDEDEFLMRWSEATQKIFITGWFHFLYSIPHTMSEEMMGMSSCNEHLPSACSI